MCLFLDRGDAMISNPDWGNADPRLLELVADHSAQDPIEAARGS